MNEKNAIVRMGAYFLQGVNGWGHKKLANQYTMEEATKVAAKLRKAGYNCKAVWITIPPRIRPSLE